MMFNLKLIPEFDGSASESSVVKWIEKAELVCKKCQMKYLEPIVPLRLMGGMFAVYQHLKEEEKEAFCQIKSPLFTAFATDGVLAYEQFAEQNLHPEKSVDVYLAELKRLDSV